MNTYYDPKERIYLLLLKEPLTKEKISKKLYGSRNTRVYDYVKELHKQDWITIVQDKHDGRRNICYPKSKGLIDTFSKDINLTPGEIKKLKEFFNKPVAMNFIRLNIDNIGYDNISLDKIKDIIGFFSIFVCLFAKYSSSKMGTTLSIALKSVKHSKDKDYKNLKKDVVSSFNKFAPSIFQTDVDSLNNSYMDFFFEFVMSLNVPLLIKLCELNSNADGYFLLGTALFTWKETVDKIRKKKKVTV